MENLNEALKSNTAKPKEPKKLWDNYIEVGEVQKNERLKFVIAVCARDGYRCVNIREFYYVKRDNVWKPGRDGILIPITMPLTKTKKPDPNNPPKMLHPMEDLMALLPKVIETAKEMPLDDPNNAIYAIIKKEGKTE